MISIFLKNLFNSLNNNSIKYCVLRNYETLPETLNGSDLDILIHKKDVIKFYKVLDEVLVISNGKIITKYGKLTPRICIAGSINNGFYGLQIDVHEGILPYKIFGMFPADFLLERANLHNNIFVANDNDGNLIAFFKEILNNGTCKEKYFNDAKKVWSNSSLYRKDLKKIYDDIFLEKLDNLMDREYNLENIKELAKIGRKNLLNTFNKRINALIFSLGKSYRFIKPPGFTIAFLGTDGAGKSTIIDSITTPLNEAVHNSLYYEHMRPNLMPNIAQLFGKKVTQEKVTNPHSSKPSGYLGSLFRLCYYTFDYIFGYLIKVYPQNVRKSSIWFFDRYYYDYLIDQKRARINLPLWIIKIISYTIPKPNLIICLGANPDVIFERKPELPLSEIKIQVNKLKDFTKETKYAHWIDTEKPIQESTSEVFELIINNMAKRY